ncbi:MAG: hypothetical protein L3K14_09360 [Thermoplasmata archaeon]|nr:hypothetical protein [Thermoplasmata archaeon]
MAGTPGNAEIGVGAFLLALVLLYVAFGVECGALLGCFVALPGAFFTFDAIFLGLIVLLVGVMLLAAGAIRRARARLPAHIV